MLEHLWIEVQGKNKKLSYLIGIVYQLSTEIAKKQNRLKKLA